MSARFHWGLRGLDEAKFRAYANLLRLRHNGQVQAPSIPARDQDDTTCAVTNNDDDSDANTLVPEELVSFNETRLKETFQDRVAELVSTEKGGYHVAANLFVEQDGRAKLLVAKNRRFKQRDREFLDSLQSTLREISNDGDSDERLWQELISYHEPRLQGQISELRQCFKALNAILCDDLPMQTEERSKLVPLILGFRDVIMGYVDLPDSVRLDLLTRAAHDIRKSYTEQEFTDAFSIQGKDAKRLYLALCFLGRLRAAYYVMIRAAERLPSFKDLSISPVALGHNQEEGEAGNSENKSRHKSGFWTLAQTFESLRVPFNDKQVRLLLGQNWSKGAASARFNKNQTQTPQTHVEMQLLAYVAQNGIDGRSVSGYIGCSKRSCFLCWTFLQAYGDFRTRGCHGKCYNIWRVPEIHQLSEDGVTRLKRAVVSTQVQMVKIITSPPELPLPEAKESTIGGSSLATIILLPSSRLVRDLAVSHIQRQREDQMIRKFKRLSNSATRPLHIEASIDTDRNTVSSQVSPEHNDTDFPTVCEFDESWETLVPPTNPRSPSGQCCACVEDTARRCSYCGESFFCSRSCEERMPLRHLSKCNARAITTADILNQAVLDDLIPEDPQTLEDYGFANCQNWTQQSHLLGLYAGLLLYIEVRRETLHRWKTQGTLVENIIKSFETWPAESRGGYFPWFLKHTDLLDWSNKPSRSGEDLVDKMIGDARLQLSPEERPEAPWKLKPPTKRVSFLTYSMFRQCSHPPPNFKIEEWFPWFEFGFCVCDDRHEEGNLGGLYNRLTSGNKFYEEYNRSLGGTYYSAPQEPHCTFEQFWQAYDRGTLVQLMDKYKLRRDRQSIRNLDTFLSSGPHRPRPSVWKLKHLLAFDDLNFPPEIMAAANDYGFSRNMSLTERSKLTIFYRELFRKQGPFSEFDPLGLHSARQKGRLLEYAWKYVDVVDPDVVTILRNLPRS